MVALPNKNKSMKIIYTKKGEAIRVDDEDYQALSSHPWHIHTEGYAKTYRKQNGKTISIYMHRLLMSPPKGLVVDHINGDKTDNRKSNLRICKIADNIQRSPSSYKSKSGIKGVRYDSGKWVSVVKVNGKPIYLGRFSDLDEAAAVYKEASLRYHGIYSPHYKQDAQ